MNDTTFFLPTTKKELEALGWHEVDIILISGDAYVDHSSFGTALIGRFLQQHGYKVAIIAQPNWQDDLRDFKKLGTPRLFFGISSGNMDSMVNHYTANKRLRSTDAYTPGGKAGFRPDYATTIYANIIKSLYPTTPIVLGGIEASMRRLSHYDYWSDQLKPSILIESGADVLVYGMGERPIVALAQLLEKENWRESLQYIPQIAFKTENITEYTTKKEVSFLHSYEEELKNRKKYAENFVIFEEESNKIAPHKIIQKHKNQYVIINPPFPPATEEEMDRFALFDKMMNLPHPKYAKRGDIPAFEMIKNSITIHRGCFGGCSFCAIAAHQGKFIASRSQQSILAEIDHLSKRPYFKGHITDLGGPSANMYQMKGKNANICEKCKKTSCIFPTICKNLNIDHSPLINLYQKALTVNHKKIKYITIGSGIRYDMLLTNNQDFINNKKNDEYLKIVLKNHVSGRLKVAPEHTEEKVLSKMRKPPFANFVAFHKKINDFNANYGKSLQLIPYFISSHPNCTKNDMIKLNQEIKKYNLIIEQVQEFTPTPMTYATAMYYLGFDPYTGEKVFSAKSIQEKKEQHLFFFQSHQKKRNFTRENKRKK